MKSKIGFILALIGGIGNVLISMIIGLFLLLVVLAIYGVGVNVSKTPTFLGVVIGFFIWASLSFIYFLILGFFGIFFAIKINTDDKIKIGSIGCLICGIFSINVFLIIGSILGFRAMNKIDSAEQSQ